MDWTEWAGILVGAVVFGLTVWIFAPLFPPFNGRER